MRYAGMERVTRIGPGRNVHVSRLGCGFLDRKEEAVESYQQGGALETLRVLERMASWPPTLAWTLSPGTVLKRRLLGISCSFWYGTSGVGPQHLHSSEFPDDVDDACWEISGLCWFQLEEMDTWHRVPAIHSFDRPSGAQNPTFWVWKTAELFQQDGVAVIAFESSALKWENRE